MVGQPYETGDRTSLLPVRAFPLGENSRNSKVRQEQRTYPGIVQVNIRAANWTAGGGRASLPSVPLADQGGGEEADEGDAHAGDVSIGVVLCPTYGG